MKIRVYDRMESEYLGYCSRLGIGATSNYNLWTEREVTDEELLALAKRGEQIMINVTP